MQNGCVRTKKIASNFVPVEGLQPPSREGLMRSAISLPRTYSSCKECFERGSSAASSFVVCLVALDCLVE